MILIISAPGDVHAEAVQREIGHLGGESRILDLSAFPARASLSIEYAGTRPTIVFDDGVPLDFSAVGSIWWRRPQPFGFDEALDDQVGLRFAMAECTEAVTGLWQILDGFWINDPHWDDRAHRKVLQLAVAREIGMHLPRTVVTNDPGRARAFVAEGANIYKPFSATDADWRETRIVTAEDIAQLDLLRHAPLILQRYVEGVDIRVTCVGDRIFAAEIDVRASPYPFDFRMSMADARIAPCTLPEPLEDGIRRLMRWLNLVYGALDFRRTADGEHVFLEVNPAGQWLFVEEPTGLPIAQALARRLMEGRQT